jgi:hypothetical protein
MASIDYDRQTNMRAPSMERPDERAKTRLVEAVFGGRYSTGGQMELSEIAAQFRLDESSILHVLQNFQTLGMASLFGTESVISHASKPKEMHEAYEIRAGLEEVGARAAARVLKGNVKALRREIDAMRVTFREQDLGSLTLNDVPLLRAQELLETTAAHLRPLIPQIASAVFATSSKEPVSPLARATNIAPSSAETNNLAFPLAAAVWAPALSKTRISQSSFARKNSRTSAETSVGTPSTSAPIIPQRHMRPPESAARNKPT